MNDILPQHAKLIEESAIDPVVAAARGYRSVRTKADLRCRGFSGFQCQVPALLIPVYSVHGEVATYQIRPDEPRIDKKSGKAIKYETIAGDRMVIDVPPASHEKLGDPAVPLFITEGIRKADAAVSKGLCCIAILGVWNWRGTNKCGGKVALPDWEVIALKNRTSYLIFDSDFMEKSGVHAALSRLKALLESRGSEVLVVYLPPGPAGIKVGLDDYLATGRGVGDLLSHASAELRPLPGEVKAQVYEATPSGFIFYKHTHDGDIPVRLSNWSAQIVTEVFEDNGAEPPRRHFDIKARFEGREASFPIPASCFDGMSWVREHLGAKAISFPVPVGQDHLRCAIQMLSEDIQESIRYTHTGWRLLGGEWHYLHGGGAINQHGSASSIEVSLPESLSRYVLPPPLTGDQLRGAIRSLLRSLKVGPAKIMFPLDGLAWRAALRPADYSGHLTGPTGAGKTVLAALLVQRFGKEMDGRVPPAAWSSTANALEAMAFTLKDTLFLVDDFCPTGGLHDIQKRHADADRLLRGQGNVAGRARLRSDASLRPSKYPRGTILSTGEDVPRGQSLRARILILELSPGDLNWQLVTPCQRDAAAGLYAAVMASFLQWIAGRYEEIQSGLREEVARLRKEALNSAAHRRTPDIVANIFYGTSTFLRFAREVGALPEAEEETLLKQAWKAIGEAVNAQSKFQRDSEPVARFLELLSSALSSGKAHVAALSGAAPERPEAWGWREVVVGAGDYERKEWRPQGNRVGWVEKEDLYIEKEAGFAVVQNVAREQGDCFPITAQTLRKRLHEKALLRSVDKARETLTVRVTAEGRRPEVLHLGANSLLSEISAPSPEEPDQPDQDTNPSAGACENPTRMAGSRSVRKKNPTSGGVGNNGASGDLVGLVGSSRAQEPPEKKCAAEGSSSGRVESETRPENPTSTPRDPGDEREEVIF